MANKVNRASSLWSGVLQLPLESALDNTARRKTISLGWLYGVHGSAFVCLAVVSSEPGLNVLLPHGWGYLVSSAAAVAPLISIVVADLLMKNER